MAEIILSQAGAVAGSALLPNGISALGQTLSGAVIGEAVGRFAGRAIDASLALILPTNGVDLVRVAAVSVDGRMGEWGSIPL